MLQPVSTLPYENILKIEKAVLCRSPTAKPVLLHEARAYAQNYADAPASTHRPQQMRQRLCRPLCRGADAESAGTVM